MKSISPSAMDSSLITRRVVCRAPRDAVVPEIYVHPIKSRYNRPHGRADRRQRIGPSARARAPRPRRARLGARRSEREQGGDEGRAPGRPRSEEHTSELQSPCNLVCRLLLEKKKKNTSI